MQTVKPETEPSQAVWQALQSAHQLGVLSRVSRKVVSCRSIVDIADLVETITGQLQLAGIFRACTADESVSRRLGQGLLDRHVSQLAALGRCEQKIQSCDSAIVFHTTHLLMVVDTHELSECESGMLRDNMMVLIDTLDFWLQQYAAQKEAENTTNIARKDIAERINDIVNSMLRFSRHLTERHQHLSQNLLTDLLLALTTLALDPDQEESMINMVTHANSEHGNLIDLQIHHNNEMRDIMTEAIDALLNDSESTPEQSISVRDDSADSDDITLF